MAKPLPFVVEEKSRSVHVVRLDVPGKGWEQWFLLSSDRHHDNPHCNQKYERKHLDQALERRAGIIDNGDLFCAMQGKYDKRSNKKAIRPEHQEGNYLDRLVDTAADFYAPYASNIIVLGQGNHETKILEYHETNLTDRLVTLLNSKLKDAKRPGHVYCGGYGGWVRFQFTIRGAIRTSRNLYRFHGTGGGGPVTRGSIQTNRLAVFTPDAHVVLTGHTHDEWTIPIARHRISDHGVLYHDLQHHVRSPGYKDAWDDGYGGWEVEKMLGPKPMGSNWMRFSLKTT